MDGKFAEFSMAGEYVPIQDQGCDTKDDGSGDLATKCLDFVEFELVFFTHFGNAWMCPEQSDVYEIH